MPELPEVETTRQGIAPHIEGHIIKDVIIRNQQLRWPVPNELDKILVGQRIARVQRRAKYLFIICDSGTLMVHLGMSGSLRIADPKIPPLKHDHVELTFDNGKCLRYCDPRRFGAWLWTTNPAEEHHLLNKLGPEPLMRTFSGKYLKNACIHRKQAIKTTIMDGHVVVGVGNIYANEALFMAGLLPVRSANSLTDDEYNKLATMIKQVLSRAIKRGGTTLRDFVGGDGKPGYFSQELLVYGRTGQPCTHCGAPLLESKLGQRTTVFCSKCQK